MQQRLLCALFALTLIACGGGEPAEPQAPALPQGATPDAPQAAQPAPKGPQTFTLAGRVVDPWSTPVEGASVRLVPKGEPESTTAVTETSSGADGRFTVEVPGAGPWTLFARHPNKGFERFVTGEVRRGETYPVRDLRLGGEGRFAGQLVDAAGTPMDAVPVMVFERSLLLEQLFRGDERFDLDALPLWAPKLDTGYLVPGKGFRYAEAQTRPDGRFELKGLAPGEYLLYSPALGDDAWRDPERTWLATSREDLALRSPLCQVVLAVGDDGALDEAESAQGLRRRVGAVEVFPTLPTATGPKPVIAAQFYAQDEANVFNLAPGDYVARAITYPPNGRWGATLHTERRFTIVEGTASLQVPLEFAQPERPKGRLRVSVTVPEGWDAPERFHLMSPLTAMEYEVSDYTPYSEMRYGEWLDVPEGEYLVALLPFEDFKGRSDVDQLAACYRRVTVRAGQDTESEVRATYGGRLKLQLDADRFVLGRDLVLPEDLGDGDRGVLKGLFERSVGAVVCAERDGDGPALKLRLRELGGVGIGERQGMLPGETITHFSLLEPGEWTLWVYSSAFDLDGAGVTVTERLTEPVEFRLRVE